MNKYQEMKNQHQEEVNKFPMFFAFTKDSFLKGLRKLGLTETQADKLCWIGSGGYIRKEDKDAFAGMFKRHRQQCKEAMDADSTGEGFIREMFVTELANHEYTVTMDVSDTLDALNLTGEQVNASAPLRRGLALAIQDLTGCM